MSLFFPVLLVTVMSMHRFDYFRWRKRRGRENGSIVAPIRSVSMKVCHKRLSMVVMVFLWCVIAGSVTVPIPCNTTTEVFTATANDTVYAFPAQCNRTRRYSVVVGPYSSNVTVQCQDSTLTMVDVVLLPPSVGLSLVFVNCSLVNSGLVFTNTADVSAVVSEDPRNVHRGLIMGVTDCVVRVDAGLSRTQSAWLNAIYLRQNAQNFSVVAASWCLVSSPVVFAASSRIAVFRCTLLFDDRNKFGMVPILFSPVALTGGSEMLLKSTNGSLMQTDFAPAFSIAVVSFSRIVDSMVIVDDCVFSLLTSVDGWVITISNFLSSSGAIFNGSISLRAVVLTGFSYGVQLLAGNSSVQLLSLSLASCRINADRSALNVVLSGPMSNVSLHVVDCLVQTHEHSLRFAMRNGASMRNVSASFVNTVFAVVDGAMLMFFGLSDISTLSPTVGGVTVLFSNSSISPSARATGFLSLSFVALLGSYVVEMFDCNVSNVAINSFEVRNSTLGPKASLSLTVLRSTVGALVVISCTNSSFDAQLSAVIVILDTVISTLLSGVAIFDTVLPSSNNVTTCWLVMKRVTFPLASRGSMIAFQKAVGWTVACTEVESSTSAAGILLIDNAHLSHFRVSVSNSTLCTADETFAFTRVSADISLSFSNVTLNRCGDRPMFAAINTAPEAAGPSMDMLLVNCTLDTTTSSATAGRIIFFFVPSTALYRSTLLRLTDCIVKAHVAIFVENSVTLSPFPSVFDITMLHTSVSATAVLLLSKSSALKLTLALNLDSSHLHLLYSLVSIELNSKVQSLLAVINACNMTSDMFVTRLSQLLAISVVVVVSSTSRVSSCFGMGVSSSNVTNVSIFINGAATWEVVAHPTYSSAVLSLETSFTIGHLRLLCSNRSLLTIPQRDAASYASLLFLLASVASVVDKVIIEVSSNSAITIGGVYRTFWIGRNVSISLLSLVVQESSTVTVAQGPLMSTDNPPSVWATNIARVVVLVDSATVISPLPFIAFGNGVTTWDVQCLSSLIKSTTTMGSVSVFDATYPSPQSAASVSVVMSACDVESGAATTALFSSNVNADLTFNSMRTSNISLRVVVACCLLLPSNSWISVASLPPPQRSLVKMLPSSGMRQCPRACSLSASLSLPMNTSSPSRSGASAASTPSATIAPVLERTLSLSWSFSLSRSVTVSYPRLAALSYSVSLLNSLTPSPLVASAAASMSATVSQSSHSVLFSVTNRESMTDASRAVTRSHSVPFTTIHSSTVLGRPSSSTTPILCGQPSLSRSPIQRTFFTVLSPSRTVVSASHSPSITLDTTSAVSRGISVPNGLSRGVAIVASVSSATFSVRSASGMGLLQLVSQRVTQHRACASGGHGQYASPPMFSDFVDNPLQISVAAFGVPLSSAGGAMFGCLPLFAIFATVGVIFHALEHGVTGFGHNLFLAARAPDSYMLAASMVLQPVVAASFAILIFVGFRGTIHDIDVASAVGCSAMMLACVVAVPLLLFAVPFLRSYLDAGLLRVVAVPTAVENDIVSRACNAFRHVMNSPWVWLPDHRNFASVIYYRRFGGVVKRYRPSLHWFCVAELSFSVVNGALSGASLGLLPCTSTGESGSGGSMTAAALNWLILFLTAAFLCLSAYLRPYAALFDNAYLVMSTTLSLIGLVIVIATPTNADNSNALAAVSYILLVQSVLGMVSLPRVAMCALWTAQGDDDGPWFKSKSRQLLANSRARVYAHRLAGTFTLPTCPAAHQRSCHDDPLLNLESLPVARSNPIRHCVRVSQHGAHRRLTGVERQEVVSILVRQICSHRLSSVSADMSFL